MLTFDYWYAVFDCELAELGEPVSFELLNHREVFKIGSTSGVLETKQGAELDREQQSRYVCQCIYVTPFTMEGGWTA